VILNTKVYSETTQKLKIDQHESTINNGADLTCAPTETKIECFIGERKLPIWKEKPEQCLGMYRVYFLLK
jgi:hypothetical protein